MTWLVRPKLKVNGNLLLGIHSARILIGLEVTTGYASTALTFAQGLHWSSCEVTCIIITGFKVFTKANDKNK